MQIMFPGGFREGIIHQPSSHMHRGAWGGSTIDPTPRAGSGEQQRQSGNLAWPPPEVGSPRSRYVAYFTFWRCYKLWANTSYSEPSIASPWPSPLPLLSISGSSSVLWTPKDTSTPRHLPGPRPAPFQAEQTLRTGRDFLPQRKTVKQSSTHPAFLHF